ncbi:helix-turn-helix domain-containing protein [Novosphingobium aromaticivorans]|uniref:helix-turn-helix domain-containing protein n=1 Tax=Novosphingobium aromaticivorans TaxID=48935 RepID=UPI00003C8336|nr:helix-turn-helix domain-containing protein [Novosphingobium aromaticivorans]
MHEDVDAQARSLFTLDQNYMQVDPGPFCGTMATCDFGTGLVVSFEQVNKRVLQVAAVPFGTAQVALILEAGEPTTHNQVGRIRNAGVVMAPGAEARLSAGANTRVCLISIAGEAADHLRSRYNFDPDSLRADIFLDPAETTALRGLVTEAYQRFSSPQADRSFDQASAAAFHEAVLSVTAWTCASSARTQNQHRVAGDCRTTALTAAIRLIDHNLHNPVTVEWLARTLGVSRRSLEQAFGEAFDTSPGRYIKVLRLNSLRQMLRDPSNAEVSIGDLAARCGLWHQGRLASEFRELFGVLPSEARG